MTASVIYIHVSYHIIRALKTKKDIDILGGDKRMMRLIGPMQTVALSYH